eukprot:GHVP01045418.1.p1 GENE.GHVP01045418.1~~GHVP01045418.1.p1  ORF type:complete len:118 (+),score=19.31 GHVP01045418.1:217-570(+)
MHLPASNVEFVNSAVAYDLLSVESDLAEYLKLGSGFTEIRTNFHLFFPVGTLEEKAEKFLNENFRPSFLSGFSDKDVQDCDSIFPDKGLILAHKNAFLDWLAIWILSMDQHPIFSKK